MRLEFLFLQIVHAASGQSMWDTRAALQILFEIFDLTVGRNELKSELIKELERHANSLRRLKQSPGVDMSALEAILGEISQVNHRVHALDNMAFEGVRQNEFLVTIRQRSRIQGGTCPFDLPSLHHWLQKDYETRTQHLADWLRPFQPLQDGVHLILRVIRNSAIPTKETCLQGFYQKNLDSNAPNQMVRVTLPANSELFPEISGGRHRFSIRFMEQFDPKDRPTQTSESVQFGLSCCVI